MQRLLTFCFSQFQFSQTVNTNPTISESDKVAAKPASPYRRAIVLSVVAHVVLFIGLLFWYLPDVGKQEQPGKTVASSSPASSATRESPRPEPADIGDEVTSEEIEKSVESQVDRYSKVPDEKKLSELEKNLKRLDSIATEESVAEVTTTIATTLGLDTEQYAEKSKPVEGEFDLDTAQLKDVTRSQDKNGRWQYESVLVDSEGRERTVPMASAEGETVYQAFEQMKKFPLAQGIYRSVVMPMVQKMMAAQDAAQKAVVEAQRMQKLEQAEMAEEFRKANAANPKTESEESN